MKINAVLSPSTMRVYPNAQPPAKKLASIDAALNERFSFQIALRSTEAVWVQVELDGPEGWSLRTRRVGLVPVAHLNTPVIMDPLDCEGLGHIPGYNPDPLFDETKTLLPQEETNAFWFTVIPGPKAKAGKHALAVTVKPMDGEGNPAGKAIVRKLAVNLHDIVIKPRRDFNVTHWFYNDALIDWYKTNLFDKTYWEIIPNYLRDIAEHGQDTVYVPVFTPPLDGVKRPSQLLRVTRKGKDKYAFDWRDVRRYVRIAKECGITHFEWTHLFTQWGAKYAIRIYEGQGADEKLLWPADTPATSDTYRAFLSQFLPSLKRFLDKEKILDVSFFHVSDEPHGDMIDDYRADRALLKELAPWMKTLDSPSNIDFAKAGLVDMPVPEISVALEFLKNGLESWCYYCCVPRGKYLNHLMDTPLAKIAMHGFLFYRWPLKGFLHWGLNYWCISQTRTLIDPYRVSDAMKWPDWPYGDPFLIYPGEKGPVDSIRWEVFADAMQDYALLQTLGIERDSKLLSKINSFQDFPKDASWRIKAKKALYKMAESTKKPAKKTARPPRKPQ